MNREERKEIVELMDRVSSLEKGFQGLQATVFGIVSNIDLLIKNAAGISNAIHKIVSESLFDD